MTDTDRALEAVARAASELLPQLTERLAQHSLGEIEVSDGELRLRVVASRIGPSPVAGPDGAQPAAAQLQAQQATPDPATLGVTSPAVGFFIYADGLGPGLAVRKGDQVGHVEMLGVRHEVRVPRGGMVRNLVAESGEAVEYGQVVVELEPAEASR
jgi:acetyl-CoA carboxylase biotin carboxyl carrier protein